MRLFVRVLFLGFLSGCGSDSNTPLKEDDLSFDIDITARDFLRGIQSPADKTLFGVINIGKLYTGLSASTGIVESDVTGVLREYNGLHFAIGSDTRRFWERQYATEFILGSNIFFLSESALYNLNGGTLFYDVTNGVLILR